jgi:hypothetical protein
VLRSEHKFHTSILLQSVGVVILSALLTESAETVAQPFLQFLDSTKSATFLLSHRNTCGQKTQEITDLQVIPLPPALFGFLHCKLSQYLKREPTRI